MGFLGGGGGFGMGTRMRVRVGDLPGLTEMLVEMAAKAEPRVYRRWR